MKELPELKFETQEDWEKWLDKNHDQSPGISMKLAKKDSGIKSITYPEALEIALIYGWIDGVRTSAGENYYTQRFTPRTKTSKWSKINREKALLLIKDGRMKPAGVAEVERAKKDGRWEAAYESQRTIQVPDDLQAALDGNPKAAEFFKGLSSQNRYAVLFRIHDAKRPETRAARIAKFVEMLAEGKTFH